MKGLLEGLTLSEKLFICLMVVIAVRQVLKISYTSPEPAPEGGNQARGVTAEKPTRLLIGFFQLIFIHRFYCCYLLGVIYFLLTI